jgi:hypothetical protein
MASQLTPASIGRLQSLGIMSFYAGHLEEAETALRRVCLVGLDSKMFDCQSLVLMAFVQFGHGDHKALQRCAADFERVVERNPELERPRRLAGVVNALTLMQHHKIAAALEAVRAMIQEIRQPGFDFESASNLIGLLAQLAKRAIQLDEVLTVMDQLALRFCSSRSLTEVLAGAAKAYPVYAEHIRAGSSRIIKHAEYALSLSLRGDPTGAVNELLLRGQETLNIKLVESAEMVIARYSAKIGDTSALQARVDALRVQCVVKPAAGPGEGPRKAGALSLRVGATAARKKALAEKSQPA